jgi:hypothetical protein
MPASSPLPSSRWGRWCHRGEEGKRSREPPLHSREKETGERWGKMSEINSFLKLHIGWYLKKTYVAYISTRKSVLHKFKENSTHASGHSLRSTLHCRLECCGELSWECSAVQLFSCRAFTSPDPVSTPSLRLGSCTTHTQTFFWRSTTAHVLLVRGTRKIRFAY